MQVSDINQWRWKMAQGPALWLTSRYLLLTKNENSKESSTSACRRRAAFASVLAAPCFLGD